MKNKAITPRDVDFARWYTDVIRAAKLADYSSVKGFIVFEPNGYAIWENMQKILDDKFKELGHQNVCMPVLIPESLLMKEAELIEGFAPEGAWISKAGGKDLEERLMFRPTSETLFSDYYASHLQSYRDLPKLYNQWCNVIRWEMETKPFLRSREFLWQEGHTLHETKEEALSETLQMLGVYRWFFEEILAIPVLTGRKTEKEKFAGAEITYTIESLMYNGFSLQSGTSHFFGQKFAKAYDIKFLSRDNTLEYPWQTSWGVSTRMIGAVIMVHGDDNGLVLPPNIAPRQVVVVPIGNEEKVVETTNKLLSLLKDAGIRCFADFSQKSAGFKFAEHEVNGIPLRIEIGNRDLEKNIITFARRDTREKINVSLDHDLIAEVKKYLKDIQNNMFETAKKRNEQKTYICDNLDQVKTIMQNNPGYVKALWCGDEACELKMKEIRGTKARCIDEKHKVDKNGKCVVCGRSAKYMVVWGVQY